MREALRHHAADFCSSAFDPKPKSNCSVIMSAIGGGKADALLWPARRRPESQGNGRCSRSSYDRGVAARRGISGAFVDQRRLGAPQRVSAVEARDKPDATAPFLKDGPALTAFYCYPSYFLPNPIALVWGTVECLGGIGAMLPSTDVLRIVAGALPYTVFRQ
jgi:hypothetical protein